MNAFASPTGAATVGAPGTGVSSLGVMRSEWIKLRSLRSVWLTAALAVGSMLFFGAVGALNFASRWDEASAADRAGMDAVSALMSGWFMAQLVVGALGVLAVTSEYSSHSMAGTLSAAPRRVPVLIAKLVVPAAATFAVLLPTTLLTFWGAGLLLPAEALPSLGEGAVLRSVIAVPVCLAAVCTIGTAVGFLLRTTAGALGLLVAVILVLPGLIAGFSKALYTYVPGGAIDAIATVDRADAELPLLAWPTAALLLALYTAVAVGAASVGFLRRDA